MKLDCVLTSVNENPLYLDFVPIFIKTWNKLYPTVSVKIVLIMNTIPQELQEYKDNIILFEPINNVKTSFTSQIIRLLYPCILDYENGVLITDIDMLPMNTKYYTVNIENYDNSKFIYYRGDLLLYAKQIAMRYNVATPITWKSIFKVQTKNDIIDFIKESQSNKKRRSVKKNTKKIATKNVDDIWNWFADQETLYKEVMRWNNKKNNFICLDETKTNFKRLDRDTFNISDNEVITSIKEGIYSDYHCLRPMSQYSEINWKIYDLL